MTQRIFPVQTRKSEESDEWRTTGEKASPSAVRLYNMEHGWDKARLVLPETLELQANMRAAANVSRIKKENQDA